TIFFADFDALIFTWPYDFCCPDLQIPIIFIPHDFNFFYFFESLTFSKEYSEKIRQNLSGFFERATPVVSTQFIKSEIAKFFPDYVNKTNVIQVAAMSNLPDISPEKQAELLKKFALKPIYFLYPCSSVKPYKNLGVLAVAIYHLKQQSIDAQIVYIGSGTDAICGDATINGVCQNFADVSACNVRGLGFVSDEELVALMRGSQAVVTSSLYEAANGPAIDAWNCGVPVAMSDLPFYTEHITNSDVRATLFDPKNAISVTEALKYIIDNREKVLADAVYSKEQLQKTTSVSAFSGEYAELIERLTNV
ncbi:MAG: glycosyltransferase, partial [Rickettsiales bacterium]